MAWRIHQPMKDLTHPIHLPSPALPPNAVELRHTVPHPPHGSLELHQNHSGKNMMLESSVNSSDNGFPESEFAITIYLEPGSAATFNLDTPCQRLVAIDLCMNLKTLDLKRDGVESALSRP